MRSRAVDVVTGVSQYKGSTSMKPFPLVPSPADPVDVIEIGIQDDCPVGDDPKARHTQDFCDSVATEDTGLGWVGRKLQQRPGAVGRFQLDPNIERLEVFETTTSSTYIDGAPAPMDAGMKMLVPALFHPVSPESAGR